MRILPVLLALCLNLTSLAVRADNHALSDFLGEWYSHGPAFGQSAQSSMVWAPALNGKFIRLDYRIEMENAAGRKSLFEGVAHYKRQENNSFTAYWADNSGDLHPITAEFDGSALVSIWGKEGGKLGRTRYDLISPSEMEVTDWIKTPEGWRQFNKNKFSRKP